MEGFIGKVYYEIRLDGSKLSSDLDKVTATIGKKLDVTFKKIGSLPTIKIKCDSTCLDHTNKLIEKLLDNTEKINKNQIKIRVDAKDFDQANKEIGEVEDRLKNLEKARRIDLDLSPDLSISDIPKKIASIAIAPITVPLKVATTGINYIFRGIAEDLGKQLSSEFSKGFAGSVKDFVGKKTGISAADAGKSSGSYIAKNAYLYGELFARNQGYDGIRGVVKENSKGLGNVLSPQKLKKGLQEIENLYIRSLEERIDGNNEEANKLIKEAFSVATKPVRNYAKAVAGVGIKTAAHPFRLRKKAYLKRSVGLAQEQSKSLEIPNIDQEKAEASESINVVMGGIDFNGTRNTDFAAGLFKQITPNSYTVPFKTEFSNTPVTSGKLSDLAKIGNTVAKAFGRKEIDISKKPITKLIQIAIEKGYNPDAIKGMAYVLKLQEMFPGKKINVIGTSGNSATAEEIMSLVEKKGLKNVKGLGVGLPFHGLTNTASPSLFQGTIGELDPLGLASYGTTQTKRSASDPVIAETFSKISINGGGILRPSNKINNIIPNAGIGHNISQFSIDQGFQKVLQSHLGSTINPDLNSSRKAGNLRPYLEFQKSDQDLNIPRTLKAMFGDRQTRDEIKNGEYAFYHPTHPEYRRDNDFKAMRQETISKLNQVKGGAPKTHGNNYSAFLAIVEKELVEFYESDRKKLPAKSLEEAAKFYPEIRPFLNKVRKRYGLGEVTKFEDGFEPPKITAESSPSANLPVSLQKAQKGESLLEKGGQIATAKADQIATNVFNRQLARTGDPSTIDVNPRQINSLRDITPGDLAHLAKLGLIDASMVAGKGISVLGGMEQGLFNALPFLHPAKSIIKNTAIPAAAFGAATQVPGVELAGGALAHGVSALANIPLESLAGQTTEAIVQILQASIGKIPGLGSGLVLDLATEIGAALTGAAAGASGSLGSILAPIIGGKILLGTGASATKQLLPGLDQKSNPIAAELTESTFLGIFAARNKKKALPDSKKALLESQKNATTPLLQKPDLKALPGSDVIDAEIIDVTVIDNLKLLPDKSVRSISGYLDSLSRLKEIEARASKGRLGLTKNYASLKKQVDLVKKNKSSVDDLSPGIGGFSDYLEKEIVNINDSLKEVKEIKNSFFAGSKEQKEASRIFNELSLRKGNLKQYATKLTDGKESGGYPIQLLRKNLTEDQQNELTEALQKRGILKKGAVGASALGLIGTLFSGAANAAIPGTAVAGTGGLAALLPLLLPALGAAGVVGGGVGLGRFAFKKSAEKERQIEIARAEQAEQRAYLNSVTGEISYNNLFQGANYKNRKSTSFGSNSSNLQSPPEEQKEINSAAARFGNRLSLGMAAAIGGVLATAVIPIIASALLVVGSAGVEKVLRQQALTFTLKSTSATSGEFKTSLAEVAKTAKSNVDSELKTLEGFSNLTAAFQGTQSEGLSDRLAKGVLGFAKFRGLDKEAVQRGLLGAAQIGATSTASQEDLNQVTENIPGTKGEAAAALGLTAAQFKIQQRSRSGLESAAFLQRLGSRLQVTSDYERDDFLKTPLARIQAFEVAVEQLQLSAGNNALQPLAFGADLASKAVKLLADNFGLFIKAGAAGLILLGVNAFNAVGGLDTLKAAVSGLKSLDLKSIGQAINQAFISPTGKAIGQTALLTLGIQLAFDAYQSWGSLVSGEGTPGKVIENDMRRASEAIRKVDVELQGIASKPTKVSGENVNAVFGKDRNLLETIIDTALDPFTSQFEVDQKTGKLFKPRGSTTSEIKKARSEEATQRALNNAAIELAPETIATRDLNLVGKSGGLAELNERRRQLSIEESLDNGLDPQLLRKRQKESTALNQQIAELELPIQQYSKVYEEAIKVLRGIIDNPETSIAFKTQATQLLPQYEAQLKKLSLELSKSTTAATLASTRFRDSAINFSQANILIERNSADASTAIVRAFSGSLRDGLKRATLADNDISTIQAKQRATERAIGESDERLKGVPIAKFQKLGAVPTDITITTPEQIQRLKDLSKGNQNAALVEKEISKRLELEELKRNQSKEEANLLDSKQRALTDEAKASKEYFFSSITGLKQSRITAELNTQQLVSANHTAKFKDAIESFGTSSSNFVGQMIDIFIKSADYARIEAEKRQKEYQLQLDRFNIEQDAQNRDNASSSPQGIGGNIVSPLGGSLDDLTKKIKSVRPHERPGARRKNDDGSPRPHNGIDLTGKVGDPVYAAFSGTAQVYNLQRRYGAAVRITFTDDKNRKIDLENLHINEKSARVALGTKGGETVRVSAGQKIGELFDLRAAGVNSDPHNHIQYKINDAIQSDPDKFLLRSIANNSSIKSTSRSKANNSGQSQNVVPGGQYKGDLAGAPPALVDEILRTVGRVESNNKYNAPNQLGQTPLSQQELYGGGFPNRPGKGSNVGYWQFSKQDYDHARESDKSINNYSPQNQKKIALFKLEWRAGRAIQQFLKNPTLENAKHLRWSIGKEWEGARDGKGQRYEGRDTRQNYWNRKDNDEAFFKRLLKTIDRAISLSGDDADDAYGSGSLSSIASAAVSIFKRTYRGQPGQKTSPVPELAPLPEVKKQRSIVESNPKLNIAPLPPVRRRDGTVIPGRSNNVAPIRRNGRLEAPPKVTPSKSSDGTYSDSGSASGDSVPGNSEDLNTNQRNKEVYESQLAENDKQRKENIDNAQKAAETLQINLQNQANAAARQKRRAEYETTKRDLNAFRQRRDRTESSKYQTPDDLKKIERRKLEEAKADEIKDLQVEESEARAELQEYARLTTDLKKIDATSLGNAQAGQLGYLRITVIPDAIKYVNQRLKIISAAIEGTKKSYDSAITFLEKRLADEEKTRENVSDIKVSESQIAKMRSELEAINIYQKDKPFDLSKGDPLKLQSEIAKAELKNRFIADNDALKKEEQEATPYEKVGIVLRRGNIKEIYEESLKNVENQLAKDLEARANEILNYKADQNAGLSAKNREAVAAQLELLAAQNQLAPTYADKPIIDKNILDRDKADADHIAEIRKIESDSRRDQSEQGLEHSRSLKVKEDERYKTQIETLAQSLKNDLALASISRRQDELSRKRVNFDAGAGLANAKINLSNASGRTYKASLAAARLAKRERALRNDEALASIEEFEIKNPARSAEAKNRKLLLQRQFDFNEQAEDLRLKKERDTLNFGLSQQLGSSIAGNKRAAADGLAKYGNTFDAATLNREAALIELAIERTAKLKDFDEQILANEGDDDAVERIKTLREEYEKLSEIKLESTIAEFSRFGSIIKDTSEQFGNNITKLLTGQGTNGGDWIALLTAPFRALSNQLAGYLNSVVSDLLKSVLSPLTGQLDELVGRSPSAKESAGSTRGLIDIGIGAVGKLLGLGGGGGETKFSFGPNVGGGGGGGGFDFGSAIGGIIGEIAGSFETGGIVNPGRPASTRDDTLAYLASGEGVLTSPAVEAIGGARVINYINQHKALPPAFINGGVMAEYAASLSSPSSSRYAGGSTVAIEPPTSQGMTIEYRDIGGVPMVTIDQLEQAMIAQDRNSDRKAIDRERARVDRQKHSLTQRSFGR